MHTLWHLTPPYLTRIHSFSEIFVSNMYRPRSFSSDPPAAHLLQVATVDTGSALQAQDWQKAQANSRRAAFMTNRTSAKMTIYENDHLRTPVQWTLAMLCNYQLIVFWSRDSPSAADWPNPLVVSRNHAICFISSLLITESANGSDTYWTAVNKSHLRFLEIIAACLCANRGTPYIRITNHYVRLQKRH